MTVGAAEKKARERQRVGAKLASASRSGKTPAIEIDGGRSEGRCIAVKTAKKQRGPGRPWPKRTSGNPAGRPKGSRNKATLAAQELLDGEAEALTRKCVELALAGDITALRLCLDRILPPRKDRPVRFEVPGPIRSPRDLAAALDKLIEAVAAGEITPSEGQAIASLFGLQSNVLAAMPESERRPGWTWDEFSQLYLEMRRRGGQAVTS